MKKRYKIIFAIVVSFVLIVAVRMQIVEAKAFAAQEKLSGEVFRFHVLANSDDKEDQDLKMEVRDAVVEYMHKQLPKVNNAAETKAWAILHLDEISRVAEEVLRAKKSTDIVKAEVIRCKFPEKAYGKITLPAGWYDALRIKIGKAKGHNWWCVLYPNLCFVDSVHAVVPEESKKKLKTVLTDDEYEMLIKGAPIKIKWFFLQSEK